MYDDDERGRNGRVSRVYGYDNQVSRKERRNKEGGALAMERAATGASPYKYARMGFIGLESLVMIVIREVWLSLILSLGCATQSYILRRCNPHRQVRNHVAAHATPRSRSRFCLQ